MISDFYDITFDIYEDSSTLDGGGAVVKANSVKSSGNTGKLDQLSGSKVLYNERKEIVANFRLFCNDIAIEDKDKVKIGSDFYQVSSIDKTTLRGSNPHLEIYLLKQDE